MNIKLNEARKIAYKKKLIKNDEDLQISTRKNKRFMILYNNKWVHFGYWPFSNLGTFLDHGDKQIKKNWKARHSKIMKEGKEAFKNKSSPEYYSWRILW